MRSACRLRILETGLFITPSLHLLENYVALPNRFPNDSRYGCARELLLRAATACVCNTREADIPYASQNGRKYAIENEKKEQSVITMTRITKVLPLARRGMNHARIANENQGMKNSKAPTAPRSMVMST